MIHKSLVLIICLSTINIFALTTDEKAIKKTIEDETYYFTQNDFEKFSDLWVHSTATYYSIAQSFNHVEFHGWETISVYLKEQMEQFSNPEWKPEKTDYLFRIAGNMAFVTFKEDNNASTRVLEKQNGMWKILELSVVQIADPLIPTGGIANTDWQSRLSFLSPTVYAMGSLNLKADVDTTAFETFIISEFNPLGAICIPGCKYLITKSDRGAKLDKYLLIVHIESRYVRNLYWPEQNPGGSKLFWAAWEASGVFKDVLNNFNNYTTGWPKDWSDFVIIK